MLPKQITSRPLTYTPRKTAVAFGDSITLNYSLGCLPSDFWPTCTEVELNNNYGCDVKFRNFGNSGDTSAQILARITGAFRYETPDLACIMAGVNDPGGTGVQTNIECMIHALQNRVTGVVAGQANLPAFDLIAQVGYVGQRFLVISDTSTTGGVATAVPNAGQPPTVTGTLTGPRIWICRNPQAGEAGWSRVAFDTSLGVQNIMVLSAQWLHYANGAGDMLALDYAPYVPIRAAQLAAATAANVPFFDTHAYERAIIAAGADTELSGTFAVRPNDQHPSAHAGRTIGRGVAAFIAAQSGWIADLT